MALTSILANVSCSDLERSTAWYATIFERQPDENQMDGLMEWYVGKAGFQLFRGPGAKLRQSARGSGLSQGTGLR